jgi:hypothetical protein
MTALGTSAVSYCVAAIGSPVAGATKVAFQQREMVCVRGGTFRIGSGKHYPAEAPVHRVLSRLLATHLRGRDRFDAAPAEIAIRSAPSASTEEVPP